MRHSMSFTLLTLIIIIIPLAIHQNKNDRALRGSAGLSAMSEPASSSACLSHSDVSSALHKLSSAQTYSEQQGALILLRADAGRSPICRKQIIGALIAALDKPNLDLLSDRPSFYLWHYGSKLLADLKAVEALDLLIAHLELNDGSSFPLNHYPALGGVIDMGEIALPKLDAVLRQNPDRNTRRYAAFCIASIGGPSAKRVLKQSVATESDHCVAAFITASLEAFNNKILPDHIVSENRTRWYGTFLCDAKWESIPPKS
jgi:hypothetical protein